MKYMSIEAILALILFASEAVSTGLVTRSANIVEEIQFFWTFQHTLGIYKK